MILTDYYKFERLATKAKTRMDCTLSTHSYPEFEERTATRGNKATDKRDAINVGDIIIYYGDVPTQYGGDVHRKADKSISIKGKNLSSVYVPDVTKPSRRHASSNISLRKSWVRASACSVLRYARLNAVVTPSRFRRWEKCSAPWALIRPRWIWAEV